jgi:TonB-linked SusC/RagA family outer membrane protein
VSSNATYNFVPENNIGYTARLGYDFKNKYLFQFNMGYNGSDRFSADKRFGFFPAVSVGWNLSEEKFLETTFIDQLKLRSSYGIVGSDGTNGVYTYQQTYTLGSANTSFGVNHTGYPGVTEGTLPNDEVTWEKEKKFDVGVDFSFFKGKVSGTVDYFYNNRYDILTSRGTVSAVFGQTLPLVNVGETENKGYEVELGIRDRIGKDFTWGIRGTYSLARNKVLNRDESPSVDTYRLFTGKPIGAELLYRWIGFYTEAEARANTPVATPAPRAGDLKYADLNGDGVINSSDQFAADFSNFPPITYGLTLNLGYKAFNLSVLYQGAAGNYVRAQGTGIMAFSSQIQPIHYEYWTPEKGDASKWHGAYTTAGLSNAVTFPSTFWARKADYSRIRSAELSFTVPAKFAKKIGAETMRVYSNGYNLITWAKSADFYNRDPELNNGQDANSYPPMKSYNFGVNITF